MFKRIFKRPSSTTGSSVNSEELYMRNASYPFGTRVMSAVIKEPAYIAAPQKRKQQIIAIFEQAAARAGKVAAKPVTPSLAKRAGNWRAEGQYKKAVMRGVRNYGTAQTRMQAVPPEFVSLFNKNLQKLKVKYNKQTVRDSKRNQKLLANRQKKEASLAARRGLKLNEPVPLSSQSLARIPSYAWNRNPIAARFIRSLGNAPSYRNNASTVYGSARSNSFAPYRVQSFNARSMRNV